MNIINVRKNGWLLEIDLDGGRVVKLEKDRQKILGTYNRIDGKIGNTHICVPNFSSEGVEKFGFIFHGPFRNSGWNVVNINENSVEINCEIEDLLVNQVFEIGKEFSQKIKVKNIGNEKKRVHVAIHNYWDTEFGWSGIKLNGHNITPGFIDNPEIKLEKNNILDIPEKKIIYWQIENFKKAKLWTGMKEEGGKKVYDKKYVCIEPMMEYEGFVETDESWLEPNDKLIVEQRIDIER
jgi:hypothetical protein